MTKEELLLELKKLTEEERLEIFSHFCMFCGNDLDNIQHNLGCMCMRDD